MSTEPFSTQLARGAWRFVTPRAVVRVSGPDARGFLHRMSTQHVEALAAGKSRLSALTNKQGRLIDLVHHLSVDDDEVLLVGTHKDGAALVEWLDGFLFVEKVELADLTAPGAVALVAGPDAPAVVAKVLGAPAPADPWGATVAADVIALRDFDLVVDGGSVPSFLVVRRGAGAARLDDELAAAGAEAGAADLLEEARVATGVPGPGEVSERYNPLELALHDAIHWAKGCYIGQEVIARIDNYGKQARQLVGLVIDDDDALRALAPGAEVRADGKAVGEVTSVSPRPSVGRIAALAVVKLRGDVDGSALEVAGEGGTVRAVARRRPAEQAPHD